MNEKKQSTADLADKYMFKTYGRFPLTLIRGEGCRVWDEEGKEYIDFYAGAGAALVNVQANKDLLDVNDSIIIPEVLTGMAYFLSEYYNVFLDLAVQFGSVKVRNDTIPLTGLRLILGLTMYLTE